VAGCAKLITTDDACAIAGQLDVRSRLAIATPCPPVPSRGCAVVGAVRGQTTAPLIDNDLDARADKAWTQRRWAAARGKVFAIAMISSPTRTGALKYINDPVHRVKGKSPRGTWTIAPTSPRILSRSGTIHWRKLTSCSSS
jgi:hypothetical protein